MQVNVDQIRVVRVKSIIREQFIEFTTKLIDKRMEDYSEIGTVNVVT